MSALISRRLIRGVLIILLCITASVPATSGPILSYTESQIGPGLWQYDFTAVNGLDPALQADFNLYDVLFQFPSSPTVIALPFGWDYFQNINSIESFSTNVGPPPFGTDVPPGTSLDGFSFQFSNQIGSIPFTFTFDDPNNPGQPFTFAGTSTAASVPEPSSLWMVLLVIVAFLLRHRVVLRLKS